MKTIKKTVAADFPEFDIVERIAAPMPKFWTRIFQVASVLLVISLGVIQLHEQLVALGIALPDWVAKVVAIAATVAAFLSKLTVDKEKWASQQS